MSYMAHVTVVLFFLYVQMLSHVWLLEIPWTVDHQAPLYIGFSRQEYRSGLRFPSPGDFPNSEIKTGSPGIKPGSPALQMGS